MWIWQLMFENFYSICGTFIGGQVGSFRNNSWIRWRAEMPASYPAFLM
mgnify:CR=1 FL=1